MPALVAAMLLVLLLGAAALGSSARAADERTISVTVDGLVPARLSVAPGTVVRWRNDTPDALVRIISTSGNWSYDSQLVPPGQSSPAVTMDRAGSYDYRAARSSLAGGVEGSSSDGSVVVAGAAGSTSVGPRPSASTVFSPTPRPTGSAAPAASPSPGPSPGTVSASPTARASATPSGAVAGGTDVGSLAGLLGASPPPGQGSTFPAPEVAGAVPFAPTVGSTLSPGTAAPSASLPVTATSSPDGGRGLVLPAVLGVLVLAGVVGAVVRVLLAETAT